MQSATLLLNRNDVAALLTIEECINAVEESFRLYATGQTLPPKILGIHSVAGSFHIKAALLDIERPYFAAKTNANFPLNQNKYHLPLIQGIITFFDAENGRLLSLMDSIEITILRTGAATAVAAKYLATENARVATICGCGNQGRISLKALMKVRQLEKVYVFDIDKEKAQKFADELPAELQLVIALAGDLPTAFSDSDIIVTCTPAHQPFVQLSNIKPGTFIAAVGADNEEKQELETGLASKSKLVVDLLEQCAVVGELHHALEAGAMTINDVHAELGEIISGKKPGRMSDEEIIVFDSTGTALQDVVAATIVYKRAIANGTGTYLDFSA